jgi:hypothetical protein
MKSRSIQIIYFYIEQRQQGEQELGHVRQSEHNSSRTGTAEYRFQTIQKLEYLLLWIMIIF